MTGSSSAFGPDGVLHWTCTIGSFGFGDDDLADLGLMPGGRLVATGTAKDKGDDLSNAIRTTVFDAQGQSVWSAHFASTQNSDDIAEDLDVDLAGDVTVTGSFAPTAAPEETHEHPIAIR